MAEELPNVSFASFEKGGQPPAIPAQEARRQAPDFFFFAPRTEELVLLRDNPTVRRQVQEENAAYGQNMPVRVLAGKPVLAYFWGPQTVGSKPFCQSCPEAMATMQRLHEQWALKGLNVVGLGIMASDGDVKAAADSYSHLLGRYAGEAAGALGINTVPGWALIDKGGSVVAASDKGIDEAYLSNRIRELVGK